MENLSAIHNVINRSNREYMIRNTAPNTYINIHDMSGINENRNSFDDYKIKIKIKTITIN